MLVLSRKPMECIQIGDNVVVTVLEIRGNKARIGIDAPKEIHVLRSELQDQAISRVKERFPPDSRCDGGIDPRGIEVMETDGPSG